MNGEKVLNSGDKPWSFLNFRNIKETDSSLTKSKGKVIRNEHKPDLSGLQIEKICVSL